MKAVEGTFTIPRRKPNSHKGDYGKLFLLAGSEGYTGAPVLAASAAVRSGAGLVFLGVPREIYPIVAVKCSSAMPFPLPERYGDAPVTRPSSAPAWGERPRRKSWSARCWRIWKFPWCWTPTA